MRLRHLVPPVALAVLATGCGSAGPAGSSAGGDAAAYDPVTVENCGADVTFEQVPERMVLLKSASVPYLADLGVLDRVVARAGQYPAAYYDDATLAALDEIPLLTDRTDSSGHLQISREAVISQQPDLVMGAVDNLSRESLDAVGIPLLEEPALCPEGVDDPSYDDVSEQLRTYGEVFGEPEAADAAVADLEQRLDAVEGQAVDDGTTAAVLYPTVGGGVTYAYGSRSMAAPQLAAAGLENVFGDVDERVFEVTTEELLDRDPDVLVLLHGDGDPDAVVDAVEQLPGAQGLTAVRDGEVMPLLFNFTEPATPLAVDGLERIVERFGS